MLCTSTDEENLCLGNPQQHPKGLWVMMEQTMLRCSHKKRGSCRQRGHRIDRIALPRLCLDVSAPITEWHPSTYTPYNLFKVHISVIHANALGCPVSRHPLWRHA